MGKIWIYLMMRMVSEYADALLTDLPGNRHNHLEPFKIKQV